MIKKDFPKMPKGEGQTRLFKRQKAIKSIAKENMEE